MKDWGNMTEEQQRELDDLRAKYEARPPQLDQCDCHEHPRPERCENAAVKGQGGLCTPCLFGCAP